MNNLIVNGIILDQEGTIASGGKYTYQIRTLATISDKEYYIISEWYTDENNDSTDTHNLYAIEANNGDAFRAMKVKEGSYYLLHF